MLEDHGRLILTKQAHVHCQTAFTVGDTRVHVPSNTEDYWTSVRRTAPLRHWMQTRKLGKYRLEYYHHYPYPHRLCTDVIIVAWFFLCKMYLNACYTLLYMEKYGLWHAMTMRAGNVIPYIWACPKNNGHSLNTPKTWTFQITFSLYSIFGQTDVCHGQNMVYECIWCYMRGVVIPSSLETPYNGI